MTQNGVSEFREAPEYREELDVVSASLAEIQAALRPVYTDLETRCLGHSALDAVEAKEVRFAQAEADIAMLTSFGAFLPRQVQWGRHYKDDSYTSWNAFVFTPSLSVAKLVQSYGVKLAKSDYTEGNYAATYAYVIGRRDINKKQSEILLVSPPSSGQYEGEKSGEVGKLAIPPSLLSAIIHPNSADAMEEFARVEIDQDLTDKQVDTLRVYGKGTYKLPAIGIPGMVIKNETYVSGSLRSGRLSRILYSGIRSYDGHEPVEPMQLVEHGLGEYDVLSRMANLAVAFGFTSDLKSLLQNRRVELSAAINDTTAEE